LTPILFTAPVENNITSDDIVPMIKFDETDEVAVSDVNETAVSDKTPDAESCVTTPKLEHSQLKAENREHLTTFNSWGTPAVRSKPGMLFILSLNLH
jgi:hypothetical protein